MKIPISDLLSHSIVIWTNKDQLNYCLKHFEDVFGKELSSKIMPIHGFNRRSKTIYYDAFSNGARNCSFAHAMALSVCEALKWPFICIFEQDAWFNSEIFSVDSFQNYLNTIPDGYTTILLGLTSHSKCYNVKDEILNDYWCKLVKYKKQQMILCGSHAYIVLNSNTYKNTNGLDNRYVKLSEQGIADNASFSNDECLCYSVPSFFRQQNTETYVNSTMHKCNEKDAYIKNIQKIHLHHGLGNQLFQLAHYVSSNQCVLFENDELIQRLFEKSFSNDVEIDIDCKPSTEYFQSEKYFDCELIKKQFKIPQSRIDEISKRYCNVNFNECVGIHVRRGDYLTEQNQQRGFVVLDSEYYQSAYKKHFNGMQCIICSDDIEWCKNNLHIENAIFSDYKDQIMDLSLLSMCKHHIGSCSTFSWWGAWLGEQKDSVNIFPPYWFRPNSQCASSKISYEILPTRWKQKTTKKLNVELDILRICNWACPSCNRFCDIKNSEANSTIMTLDDIKQIVSQLKTVDIGKLAVIGGEPTLHPNVVEILQYLQNNIAVESLALTTNGSNTSTIQSIKDKIPNIHICQSNISYDDKVKHHYNYYNTSCCIRKDNYSDCVCLNRSGINVYKYNGKLKYAWCSMTSFVSRLLGIEDEVTFSSLQDLLHSDIKEIQQKICSHCSVYSNTGWICKNATRDFGVVSDEFKAGYEQMMSSCV